MCNMLFGFPPCYFLFICESASMVAFTVSKIYHREADFSDTMYIDKETIYSKHFSIIFNTKFESYVTMEHAELASSQLYNIDAQLWSKYLTLTICCWKQMYPNALNCIPETKSNLD